MTLPILSADDQLPPVYQAYLEELRRAGFQGEVRTDYASRLVTATDNSVYQVVPLAVVFPNDEQDVAKALRLAYEERFRDVKLSARGGGTGTNGQALSAGVILDLSRNMRAILDLDLQRGFVVVQPGVVLDQLNDHLRPHGVFFAPHLSPSSRATLGGMINTDACGKGSRIYGKTSDHVLELRAVAMDGTCFDSQEASPADLEERKQLPGLLGAAYRTVDEVVTRKHGTIAKTFPRLKRFLTGYDLAHVRSREGRFNLNRVLCGSEGTLAVITRAKLRLTPIPEHRALLAIRYPDFDAALRSASELVTSGPSAIETVDDTIVELAKKDVIWNSVSHLLSADGEPPLAAVNLIEFESSDAEEVRRKVAELRARLDAVRGQPGQASGYHVATTATDISALWALRKKGVGLLGNVRGERRPVPFVEDTAVPPERLADYIAEFRQILDRHGLRYGMFGHVDVGCLHVRPALNLRDPADGRLLRQISDEVAALVQRHGGVMWAEHGKGFRSEYSPTFFGPELYAELRKVKGAFDPHNQLNPGKLATPPTSGERLVTIDAKKRGDFDRDVSIGARARYDVAIHCNGNGQCFDYQPDHVMCPSSKVTRDRIHSPKGRAGILREWLRLASNAEYEAGRPASGRGGRRRRSSAAGDFSHEVYDALNGCLACKACATQCPVKVDVPHLRTEFLSHYHTRYRRPLKDHFVAWLETLLVLLGRVPRAANWAMQLGWVQRLLRRWVGIVDSPRLSTTRLQAALAERGAPRYRAGELARLSPEEKAKTVLITPDAFTTFYEPNVALAAHEALERLGLRPVFLPYRENGKALHVKGFAARFRRVVRRNERFFRKVAQLGIPVVGIEPAVVLTYRDEYLVALGSADGELGQRERERGFRVQLLQEYLIDKLPELDVPRATSPRALSLFGHCTERTEAAQSQQQWRQVFERFGVDLQLETTGCCGMCGVFGHEARHLEESKGLFDLSWAPRLERRRAAGLEVLAAGHSCRSQVKRFAGFVPQHPIEALLDTLRSEAP